MIEETEERHREAKRYEATLNMMLERYAMSKVQEESIFKVGKALPVCWLAPVEKGAVAVAVTVAATQTALASALISRYQSTCT